MADDPISRQRDYYERNAEAYDEGWTGAQIDLMLPMAVLTGALDILGAQSLLDVGSGTGRALRTIRHLRPTLSMIGIEPSPHLREIGHRQGLELDILVDGDATALAYPDDSFDVVCEFSSLHHMPDPAKAVREMCRVASKAVYLADINNFGKGTPKTRLAKQALNKLGLWPWANLLKTRGRGYRESPGDGISYSYSVFNDLPLLEGLCRSVHAFNLDGSARDPYRRSPHVALLGILTDQVSSTFGDRV